MWIICDSPFSFPESFAHEPWFKYWNLLHVNLVPRVFILILISLSLEESHAPGCLETAVLRPPLKKPFLDHEIFGNFRPVSNLKMVSKVIEKVNVYLDKHDLKKPLQSAYQRFHSCETALVRVHNDMLRAIGVFSLSSLSSFSTNYIWKWFDLPFYNDSQYWRHVWWISFHNTSHQFCR